jgi:hypothetical protein
MSESNQDDRAELVLQRPPILLTGEEACRELGIGERLFWEIVNSGEIPVVDVGRGARAAKRYLYADLVAWAQRRRVQRQEASGDATPADVRPEEKSDA